MITKLSVIGAGEVKNIFVDLSKTVIQEDRDGVYWFRGLSDIRAYQINVTEHQFKEIIERHNHG